MQARSGRSETGGAQPRIRPYPIRLRICEWKDVCRPAIRLRNEYRCGIFVENHPFGIESRYRRQFAYAACLDGPLSAAVIVCSRTFCGVHSRFAVGVCYVARNCRVQRCRQAGHGHKGARIEFSSLYFVERRGIDGYGCRTARTARAVSIACTARIRRMRLRFVRIRISAVRRPSFDRDDSPILERQQRPIDYPRRQQREVRRYPSDRVS